MRNKKNISTISIGFALGVLATASIAMADETVTTKTETTTYTGTVSQLDPASSTIILKSETSPTPVTYTYTKDTSFVDANGNIVTYEAVRNSPVRVEYSNVGGQVVVRRVVQTGPAVVVAPSAQVPAGTVIREKTTRTETEKH
jgi:hypothetical protein